MQKIVINVHTQPLIPINAVPCPFVKSDVGICLLKYAFCLSSTEEAAFSKSSFNKDEHQQSISCLLSLCITPAILNQLRLNVLKLVCEVTCKYQSVRKKTLLKNIVTNLSSQRECNNNGSDCCDDYTHNLTSISSSTSNHDESSQSDNLDRTYYPPVYNDEDERVNSCKLYAVEASQDAPSPPKSNMCPLH